MYRDGGTPVMVLAVAFDQIRKVCISASARPITNKHTHMESRTLALRSSFSRTADCLSAAVGMSTRRSAEVRLVFWTKYITRTPDTSVVHHAVVQ